jgi:two-component system NarL family sensor kinase
MVASRRQAYDRWHMPRVDEDLRVPGRVGPGERAMRRAATDDRGRLMAPASLSEAAAESERVVAWLRLPAIALLALGQGLSQPNAHESAFVAVLVLFSVWSVAVLVWVHHRAVSEELALAATGVDIVLIGVLALLSGGAFSHARLAFFLVPVAAAFRFRPAVTAAATIVTTAAYIVQAAAHPATSDPEAARFIATQAGFLAWVGLACALLSLMLGRRTEVIARLADERSRLLSDALDAEQRERRTLAESLHDHALQNLLSSRHELEEAAADAPHPALDRADAAIAETVGQLREAVFELHPYVLEEAGLKAALRSIAQQAATRAGLALELDLRYDGGHPREALLFSAARELLGNIVKHAGATRVGVHLADTDGWLVLAVGDDGGGFPPERLADRLAEGHVGLASQRVRVEAAGGTMDVATAPGEGTRITIRLPR